MIRRKTMRPSGVSTSSRGRNTRHRPLEWHILPTCGFLWHSNANLDKSLQRDTFTQYPAIRLLLLVDALTLPRMLYTT